MAITIEILPPDKNYQCSECGAYRTLADVKVFGDGHICRAGRGCQYVPRKNRSNRG